MNPLRIFGSIAARRRGDWQYGLPVCLADDIDPSDVHLRAAVASGRGSAPDDTDRLHLNPTGKHAKAKEGR